MPGARGQLHLHLQLHPRQLLHLVQLQQRQKIILIGQMESTCLATSTAKEKLHIFINLVTNILPRFLELIEIMEKLREVQLLGYG